MSRERVHARVRGRVQGVFYRASCAEEAERLGLSGWVRNLADGSVELEAEGEAEAVERLLGWCRVGPPSAHVTDVETSRRPVTGRDDGFRVRR